MDQAIKDRKSKGAINEFLKTFDYQTYGMTLLPFAIPWAVLLFLSIILLYF